MKNLVFVPRKPKTEDKSYRLFMAYYVGLYEGSEMVVFKGLYTESDYAAIYRIVSTLLKGTRYEKTFHLHWTNERAQLPISIGSERNR